MTVNGVSCWHDMEINPKENKAAGVDTANDIYCQVLHISAALKIINIEEHKEDSFIYSPFKQSQQHPFDKVWRFMWSRWL